MRHWPIVLRLRNVVIRGPSTPHAVPANLVNLAMFRVPCASNTSDALSVSGGVVAIIGRCCPKVDQPFVPATRASSLPLMFRSMLLS